MKSSNYQRRFYRNWVKADDLYHTHFREKETDLQILTNKKINRDFIKERIDLYRWDIENYIRINKKFLTALKPLEVELTAPKIVKEMALQSKKANVGPMATVAGAVAEFLGQDLMKKGYKDVIIENGGDIFIKTRKARTLGIYCGKSKLWQKLKVKIKPSDTPLGICTSSGTIGHSLSFGTADLVSIFSNKSALADAVATACGNRVHSKKDALEALEFAKSIKGVQGVMIIIKNSLITWGKISFIS
ncbi:MAG: UPF0280 family protein [Candidatus Omnitrophica bacterium]|nr:UPF0280 family protein [Candidatus Omnitrophota bacterium]